MKKIQKGFTLIESLVYLALFAVVISTVGASTFYIIEVGEKTQAKILLGQEANFLLGKLDWVLFGASEIKQPILGNGGTYLEVVKPFGDVIVQLNGERIQIREPPDAFQDLNNDFVRVSSLDFENIGQGVRVRFTLVDSFGNSQDYSVLRGFRK